MTTNPSKRLTEYWSTGRQQLCMEFLEGTKCLERKWSGPWLLGWCLSVILVPISRGLNIQYSRSLWFASCFSEPHGIFYTCINYPGEVSSEWPVDGGCWFLLQVRDIVGLTKEMGQLTVNIVAMATCWLDRGGRKWEVMPGIHRNFIN